MINGEIRMQKKTQMKSDVPEITDNEIEKVKSELEGIYYSIKGRFRNFSDFQNVIVSYKDYHSDQLLDSQKPEEMVKQFLVEPVVKNLGFTQLTKEAKVISPFGSRYPDYVIAGSDRDDLILYVEAEPINTNLFAENKGLGQVSQWLISKAAKSEYGIATDGLLWILAKFDASSNKTKEVLRVDLRPLFGHLMNPVSGNSQNEIRDELEKLILLSPRYLRNVINDYIVGTETEKEDLTSRFYKEYVRNVFGIDENGNPTSGTCLKDSIRIPREVKNQQKELFAVITMNRILFITFLEERNLVPINLLTGLLALYKKTGQPRTFYSTYLNPLFYDVLNTSAKSRKAYVNSISEFQKIPYLNGGLFRKNLEFEDLYDIENDGIELVLENLQKYRIGLSGEAKIQPEILGYIFEKTINYISGTGKTNKQKMEGAYYTPEDVVSFIIDKTLNTKIYEKMILGLKNSGWTDTDLKGYQSIEDILHDMPKNPKHCYRMLQEIDDIKVLDPACGSGHFITAAANAITRIRASIMLAMGLNPNMYDIKRTVISKNIFGSDINEVAVEITKLRLWLSIISEATTADIESGEHIETLPNIDFNIVAGNSLVGQLNEKVYLLLSAMNSGIIDDNDMAAINSLPENTRRELVQLFSSNKIEDYSKAYMLLLAEYRTESGEKALAMHGIILKIRNILYNAVNQAFYSHLTGVGKEQNSNSQLIWKALTSRKPLHWNVDYVNVMNNGGFDVIIGNPPYIEDRNYPESDLAVVRSSAIIKDGSRPILYRSMNCGNTHAYFIERSMHLLNDEGRFGFIVPVSLVSTDRMAPVRKVIHESSSSVEYYNFDDRPGKIFSGIEHCRSTIVATRKGDGVHSVTTSKYHRWHTRDRPDLFRNLETVAVDLKDNEEIVPKVGTSIETNILEKLRKHSNSKTIGDFIVKGGEKVWYHNAPQYWIHAHLDGYVPEVEYYKDFQKDGNKISLGELEKTDISDQYKYIEISAEHSSVTAALLNSSIFYWFFVVYSDGRHLLPQHIMEFSIDLSTIPTITLEKLNELIADLMNDYEKNSNTKINVRNGGYAIKIKEIIPRLSYGIIKGIDAEISKIFSLTEEELEFIENFDIDFRLGK